MEEKARRRGAAGSTRRPTVGAYLFTAVAVSLITLSAVTAMTTLGSFDREQRRAQSQLQVAAQRQVEVFEDVSHIQAFFDQMTADPGLISMDPVQCKAVFDRLRGLVDVNAQLLRADGSLVCGMTDERAPDRHLEAGPWLEQTLAAEGMVSQPPRIDPFANTPSMLTSMRVVGPQGPIGVVASQIYSGFPPVPSPKELPAEASIFVVDPGRSMVLGATPNRIDLLGAGIDGRPALSGETLWAEATGETTGWHAQAVLPREVALAAAYDELQRMLMVGGASGLVVLLLGFLLHRRLARPVRRLGEALLASLEGDEAARAPVEGPAEVAEAAEIFNELISERHARETELAWKATHDVLTGLPNRALLTETIDGLLAAGPDGDLAVLFLDLDRFKLVNDSHGHAVGDQVLIAIGRRMVETLRGRGSIGRFGGDEFVAVCPGIGGEEGALKMAASFAEAVKLPLRFDSQEIWLAGSIGIAVAHPGEGVEDLIRNADTAMYRAKERGRGGHAVFDSRMREGAIRRLDLERDLNRALERDELALHYQPKYALDTGAMVGVEALLRWPHPERGMVTPDEFIPMAEETGLILPIGRWVLERAAAQASRWRQANHGWAFPVAVNVASLQLSDPALPAQVADSVRQAGALTTDLIIEVTESAVLQDVEGAIDRLAELRAMGVKVSIDDFGTGYSSLSYLQRLPIDELKIDRSFVERLDLGPTTAIVGSIVDLAHALELSVVAEGIETVEQLDTLRSLRCDLGQGFLLARPQPGAGVTDLLERAPLLLS